MAMAIADRRELQVHIVHDERAAAFVALGLGSLGVPALLLCSSGTAAVNFHPAVVEASMSDVPMLVLTADRPGELRGVGAPQTIDQINLYGDSVRWFADPGVPDITESQRWRPLARRVIAAGAHGPVHLNLAFREPLLGGADELPSPIDSSGYAEESSLPDIDTADVDALPVDLDVQRGVIMAGGRSGVAPEVIEALVVHTGWPLLADPLSGVRQIPGAITMADPILRHEAFAAAHLPEVVIRIGRPPASRVVSEWLVRAGARIVQVGGPGVIDPEGLVVARTTTDRLLESVFSAARQTPWRARWVHAEQQAIAVVDRVFTTETELNEPLVARIVAEEMGAGDLVVASSMPVRDLEWFGGPTAQAFANRGANGIDGTISTALGRALGGLGVTVLLGDIAFVHDASALIAVAGRGVGLRCVVIDNDGGGIFSFLPQAQELDPERFERLFGTPHGTDLAGLARAHGLDVAQPGTPSELRSVLRSTDPVGREPATTVPVVIIVKTDRHDNVDHHRSLHAAVAESLGGRPA